jgi:predicted kinase
MDLAERGQPALRHAVLQAWAETLGDFAGLPLLPYYETYRALVRAKVAALRALQFEAADPLRGAAVAQCLRYLDWAEARLAPARPTLAMTCGLSGSGKTWLASQAAERLGALHLRSDVERKRIAGLGPLDDSRSLPDAGIYTLEFNDRTYERLHDCAAAALAGGESVIVDAAFLRRGERGRFLELARARGLPCAILHCQAPDAVLRERVAARAAARSDASEAGLDVLERQPGYWEPLDERELAMTVAIDTSVSSAVASALGRLEGLGRR